GASLWRCGDRNAARARGSEARRCSARARRHHHALIDFRAMTVRVQLRRDAGRIGPQTGPWVRRRPSARFLGVPDPHALAEVVDHRGATVAFGLVSAVSTIAIRVLTFGAARPPDDWLDRRLSAAFEARRAYRFEEEGTTGYREVNTEGDGLP